MTPPGAPGDATASVIERHMRAVMARDAEALEQNLADDAVFLTPHGYVKGRQNIRKALLHARDKVDETYARAVKRARRSVHDGVGYLVYEASPFVSMGVDVWVVQNGKLAAQTYTAHPPLPYIESYFERNTAAHSDPDDEVTANTRAVIDRHLSALGNLDALVDNLAEDVLFITQAGDLHGREQVRRAFTSGIQLAPDGYGDAVETVHRRHAGAVGYLVYRAEPFVSLGTDTWVVDGDKIGVWAYAAHPMLPNLPAWLKAAAGH